MIQVAVDQTVEEMANIESALSAGGVRVAYDVDRAAVRQQIVELGVIGELVDPFQIDEQEAARIVSRRIEAIKIRRLAAMIGSHAHEVALAADHVNQFELLEQGGDRRKAFAEAEECLRRCQVGCQR
jgi:hypothetical protein